MTIDIALGQCLEIYFFRTEVTLAAIVSRGTLYLLLNMSISISLVNPHHIFDQEVIVMYMVLGFEINYSAAGLPGTTLSSFTSIAGRSKTI